MDHLHNSRRQITLFMFYYVLLQLGDTDTITSDHDDKPWNVRGKRNLETGHGVYLLGDNSSDFVTLPNVLPNLFPPSTINDFADEGGKYDTMTPPRDDTLYENETVHQFHPYQTAKLSIPRKHDDTTEAVDFAGNVDLPMMSGSLFKMLQNFNNKERLSKDIYDKLQSDRAKNFISGLKNDFQREVVLTNLKYCPFIPLCHFSLDLHPEDYAVVRTSLCCSKCSCDRDLCVSRGTCCPDVPWFVQKPAYMERGVHKSCIPSEIKGIDRKSVNRVKAVTGCPIHSDHPLVSKCMRDYERDLDDIGIEDITLVWDLLTETLYRNRYCADCNGANRTSQMAWSAKLECLGQAPIINSAEELITKVIQENLSCDIIYMEPKTELKAESCSTAISTCNTTGLWKKYDIVVDMACSLYGSIVHIEVQNNEYLSFRNVFCALCNGYDPSPIDICVISQGYEGAVDFAGFLKLSDHVYEKKDSCRLGEKYDNVKKKCRQVMCSKGRENKGGNCQQTIDGIIEIHLDIYLRLEPQNRLRLMEAYDIVPMVKNAILFEIRNKIGNFTVCGTQVFLQSSINRDEDGLNDHIADNVYDALKRENRVRAMDDKRVNFHRLCNDSLLDFYEIRFQISLESYPDNTVESLFTLNGYIISLNGTDYLRSFLEQSSHSFGVKIVQDYNKEKFDQIGAIGYFMLTDKIGKSDEVIDILDAVNYLTMFDDVANTLQLPFLQWNDEYVFCRYSNGHDLLSLRPCPMFKIHWDEFDWKWNKNGLEVNGTSIQLDTSDFIVVQSPMSKYLLICVDTYDTKFELLQSNTGVVYSSVQIARNVISIVCVSVSCICLVFSLITFCLFKQLQTLPGKNNIALIASLIFAQTLYLLGGAGNFDKNTPVCKTIGLFTHFFWLTSIFWMNVCTFHMSRVLLKTRHMAHGGDTRTYLFYHLYSIGMALVCVAINITVSMVNSNHFDMGYGKVICYVSSQMMIDFTFGVPALLVVFSNFIMFSAVVIHLKRRPLIRKSVKNERSYFLVFIKLSTVTGITWVFGFVYMWTGIEGFSFVFIILNASQGLFIMLAFVCNKRVVDLYRDFCRKRDGVTSSTDQRSTRTMSSST